MRYWRIANLEKFQHYKQRSPPWIKWHRQCLSSYGFTQLTDAQKWHAVALTLMASENGNQIPDDADWLKRRLQLTTKPDLQTLESIGFIERASTLLATCKQDASEVLAQRRGEERQSRGEINAEFGKPHSAGRGSRNGEPEGFTRWWSLYRQCLQACNRRIGYRKDALTAWKSMGAEKHAKAILARTRAQLDHFQDAQRSGQDPPAFPDPHRWLKKRRFNDEIPR